MTHKKTAAMAIALAALLAGGTADAAVTANVTNMMNGSSSTDIPSKGNGGGSASVNGSVSLTGNVSGSSTGSASGKMQDGSEDSMNNASGSMAGTGMASGNGSFDLSINGDDVRTSVAGDNDMNITAPAQVQSDEHFKVYAEMTARNDSSVRSVDADNSQVSVVFNRPAKLFGFIPVSIKEKNRIYVDGNGQAQVSASKSWWAFLASDDVDTDRDAAAIQSRMSTTGGSFDAGAGLSAQVRAQMLSSIETSSSSFYSASAN